MGDFSVYRLLEHLLVEVQLVPDAPNLAGMKLYRWSIDGGVSFMGRSNPQHWLVPSVNADDLAIGRPCCWQLRSCCRWRLIKLTSPGPVRDRGWGWVRSFNMLKFRSMPC